MIALPAAWRSTFRHGAGTFLPRRSRGHLANPCFNIAYPACERLFTPKFSFGARHAAYFGEPVYPATRGLFTPMLCIGAPTCPDVFGRDASCRGLPLVGRSWPFAMHLAPNAGKDIESMYYTRLQ